VWQPLRWDEWAHGKNRCAISFGGAWEATRQILMDHSSHSWTALTGAWYIPTGAEAVFWYQAAAEKRIKGRPVSYRPWLETRLDPFARVKSMKVSAETLQARERLHEVFNF
jgi:hypothetical protein